MTRRYFHSCITCPQCHEPHKGSYSDLVYLTVKNDGMVGCSGCGCEFYPYLDFSGRSKFIKTHEYARKLAKLSFSRINSRIPLYWDVNLNKIEEAYNEWVLQRPKGAHLITWPWDEVRFIPVLLTEFSLKNPDSSVVVIGNYEEPQETSDHIAGYSLPEIIRNTVFGDDIEAPQNKFKEEMNNLKKEKSLFFDFRDVVEVRIKKYGAGSQENDTWICQHSLGKCSNDLKKEFLENYGKGSLRNIIKKKKGGREVKGFNDKEIANGKIDPENGYWIVTLTEQEQWSGKKLNYNHLWLYEVLANYKKIRWCHDTLKPVIYYKKDKDLIKKPGSLHVISSGPETGRSVEIFRLLRDISPELLIIENADELISDIRYHGSSSSELLKYLQEAKHTTLLFSTNSEMRQFYGLHSDQNVLSSTGCTIHTLDSFSLLKWMESQSNESKYPSPLSSQLKEIISDREYRINTTYIEVPKLTEFFTKAFTLIDTLDRDVARNIRYYLRRVISSPLNIIGGDYDNPEYMTAQRGFGSIEITYDTICGDLEMSAFEGLIQSNIPKQFKQIFVDNFLPEPFCNSNPLRESMIDTAKELLEGDSEAYVTVVVHYNDIKGFKRIMEKEEMFPEQFSSRFMITGWKGLSSSGALIDDGCRHYVISSQYPSLGYSLRRSGVTEFIFISDQKGLEGIKEIINRRLLDTIAYPIVIPEDGDSIPELLREGFEATDVPKTDRMIELYSDIDDEFISFSGWKQPLSSGKQEMDVGHDSILSGLEPGEEAFLCFNDENTGIFIPIGRSVMIKDDGFFKDVTTDNSKSDAMIFRSLIGKDVILSRSGLYLSFRTIFFRFMMKNGKRMTFWKQPYMWKGFEDLFNATIEWIRLIEKTADEYAKKTSINREEALVIIASKLTEAGITATDPGTVIGWCTHCEDITIDSGTYRVYKTEHPFRCEDLRIILHVLSNLVPGAIPKKTDPDRIFAAALCLQNLRQKVLKYKSDSGDQTSLNIRAGLARELQGIVSDAEIFRPIAVQRIKLIKSVEPMRCIPKFTDYI